MGRYPDIKEQAVAAIGRQRAYAAQVIVGPAFKSKLSAVFKQLFEDGVTDVEHTLKSWPAKHKGNADEMRSDFEKGKAGRLTSNRCKVSRFFFTFVITSISQKFKLGKKMLIPGMIRRLRKWKKQAQDKGPGVSVPTMMVHSRGDGQ